MRILVTNDDGIHAKGLWEAVDAVNDLGEVIVVAPDREQSGVGAGISMNKPIHVTEIRIICIKGFVNFAQRKVGRIIAIKMIIPPIVGVPSFL